MIVFRTESCGAARVVHLDGSLESTDDPVALVGRLVAEAGRNPLVVDLTGLSPATGPGVSTLLRALAHAPTSTATVLVHPDLEARRALRALAEGLPVVPSHDLVLQGPFAAAIVTQDLDGHRP